jgi:Flp pilus assembly protein TadB
VNALGAAAFAVAIACLALAACAPAVVPGARSSAGTLRTALVARLRTRRDAAAVASRSLDVLHGTHAALRSGLPLAPALRIALERAPLAAVDPFQRALRAFELNAPLDRALRDAAREATDRRVALALEALALVAAEQLPASRAAAVVASVGDRLAFDARLADEIRARTSGVRAQIVLLALLVPALALYLVVTLPGLGATLTSPLGLFVLIPSAIAFETAGIVASRAIARGLAQ